MTTRMFFKDGPQDVEPNGNDPDADANAKAGRVLVARYEAGSGTYSLEQKDGATLLYRYRAEDPAAGTGTSDSIARAEAGEVLRRINERNREFWKRGAKR